MNQKAELQLLKATSSVIATAYNIQMSTHIRADTLWHTARVDHHQEKKKQMNTFFTQNIDESQKKMSKIKETLRSQPG